MSHHFRGSANVFFSSRAVWVSLRIWSLNLLCSLVDTMEHVENQSQDKNQNTSRDSFRVEKYG